MYKRLVILLCICNFVLPLHAAPQADYSRQKIKKESFSKPKWEQLRKKVKISEAKREKEKPEKKESKKKTSWELDPAAKQIIKWVLFSVLIGILLFLILYTLGINPFRKKKNARAIQIDIETLAEHLDEADLDPFLMEAIKSGNYKLAIRLYYLQIVQRLNLAGKIRWKRHKTNRNYVNEMRTQNDHEIFKEITLQYEKCWFGPELVTRQDYEEISPRFINYAKNLPTIE